MKKICVVIIFLSVAFTVCLSSCMDRRTAFENGNDIPEIENVEETKSGTKILDLGKVDVEKRETMTIDDIKQLVAESEELYREYDEIILLSGDKIVTDKAMRSDADSMSCSYDEYHGYLCDIKSIFVSRLSQLTNSSSWIHEEQLGMEHMMMKNLPISTSLLYLDFDIDNEANTFFKDPEYMFNYYWNETREYDIICMSSYIGEEDFFLNIYYCSKGSGHDGEIIFPTAEQQATLNEIKTREFAEKQAK